ncbi:MAG: PfkB family carbohydrate kinase [Bacteroidota bacterium]
MQKVYAVGETVLDIIFKQSQVKEAKPGGSMLNSAVSLGRAGINIIFISEYANDKVGNLVDTFLKENNVNTEHVFQHQDGKTSIAMAFLDQNNDASYVFYKTHPDQRLQITMPEFTNNDILIFGSFFGIDPHVRSKVFKLVDKARRQGALIIYDPNFRKPHASQLADLMPYIRENVSMADIVRGSNEDFQNIFFTQDIKEVRKKTGTRLPVLIMTKSAEKVFLNTTELKAEFPVKQIKPLSTIGAGDNFNAGIIFGLIKEKINRNQLTELTKNQWEKIISYGVEFASDVCMNYENYISEDMVKKLTKV